MNLLFSLTKASAALHECYLAARDEGRLELAQDLHVQATALSKQIGEYITSQKMSAVLP